MGYAILLKTNSYKEDINHYGYWSGKGYIYQGEPYPICDKNVCERTKIFKSESRATKSAELCYGKYQFVNVVEVVQI